MIRQAILTFMMSIVFIAQPARSVAADAIPPDASAWPAMLGGGLALGWGMLGPAVSENGPGSGSSFELVARLTESTKIATGFSFEMANSSYGVEPGDGPRHFLIDWKGGYQGRGIALGPRLGFGNATYNRHDYDSGLAVGLYASLALHAHPWPWRFLFDYAQYSETAITRAGFAVGGVVLNGVYQESDLGTTGFVTLGLNLSFPTLTWF